MSDEQPEKPFPWVPAISVSGFAGVLATAVANLEKITPFLDRFGMSAIVVLVILGLLVVFSLRVGPLIESWLISSAKQNEQNAANYAQQTQLMSQIHQVQGSDSLKLHEVHEVIVKRHAGTV